MSDAIRPVGTVKGLVWLLTHQVTRRESVEVERALPVATHDMEGGCGLHGTTEDGDSRQPAVLGGWHS